jgi:hypothetical protein
MRWQAPFEELFWSKVSKSDGCWTWTASKSARGYGYSHKDGRTIKAHRASWELHFGPVPPGMFVCHQCDVPSCVRPDHLFIGTTQDNTADKVSKGRQARGGAISEAVKNRALGEKHPRASIAKEKVLEIRRLWGSGHRNQSEIARSTGTTPNVVYGIVRGVSWKHVS